MSHSQRGAFIASLLFFLSISFTSNAHSFLSENEKTQLLSLSQTPRWHSLLQLKDAQALNSQTDLYLSATVSSFDEAQLTYDLLIQEDIKAYQYPARARLIAEALSISFKAFFRSKCSDYQHFLAKFPLDTLYLVYTSENVTQASSMMGHIMLKASGVNEEGIEVSHGVTFFTNLDSLNVPKIMWESLISGKEGIFQVAPYAPFVSHYVNNEQRNVYEYPIQLSLEERELIRDVIWEFGHVDSAYFFHTYDCATVTQAILGVLSPQIIPEAGSWITPLDVVKAAHDAELLGGAQLRPSTEWRLSLFARFLPNKRAAELKTQAREKQIPHFNISDKKLALIEFEYLFAYLDFLGSISPSNDYALYKTRLQQSFPELASSVLDIGEFKNPISTPSDSQVHIAYDSVKGDEDAFIIRLFPVNNERMDDNRECYGENVLTLGDIAARIELDGDVSVEHVYIYNMQSINNFEFEFKRLSSSFAVGAERLYTQKGKRELNGFVRAGLGISKVFSTRFSLCSLLQASASTGHGSFLMAEPTVGAYLYWKDIKMNASLVSRYNAFNSKQWTFDSRLSMVAYINDDFAVQLDVNTVSGIEEQARHITLNMRFGF